ncbi:S8 family serine peptidase [Microcoleus sp. herbarium7]|uniref:cyanobactin maturation protease PatG family protein n=1 Tax=Microcoleus sp. herbarium7 TaxID=3055435 RepID=UPI002FD6D3D2
MPTATRPTLASIIPGLQDLWAETLGDDRICIAILDGIVDRAHPSLAGANLTPLETLVSGATNSKTATQHGTHITSIIFGQHKEQIQGIAPNCRGLIVPIFAETEADAIAPCSQIDLARAILQAANQGANIINISGGQWSASPEADPLLANAVQYCADRNILIVAAAGNEGCDCLHIPGALPSVLAVGAMNAEGMPLDFSNWGDRYQIQGILAPGEHILGAIPGGGAIANSGTSYATPIVSGIAALLLSLQLKQGQKPDPQAVRSAILQTAITCSDRPVPDCRRILAGRLNVRGAMSLILQGGIVMSNANLELGNIQLPIAEEVNPQPPPELKQLPDRVADAIATSVQPSSVAPSACGCGCSGKGQVQLVYALGQLGYDFGTEARRDSIAQHMGEGANPQDPRQLLAYLDENPWDAAAIIWTLSLDATPIYAIQPQGAYSDRVYERLIQFLREQLTEGVERVSIPGILMGQVMLMSGQVVPVIVPTLRCMYSWTTQALVETVCGSSPDESARQGVENFLERVYYELRNLGMTPQERAINYAATNAFNVERIFEAALREEMDLDAIEVKRSPICRSNSECWEVLLTFFNPKKVFEQARKVYRFTVDVSDVCPVMVGKVRSWFVR